MFAEGSRVIALKTLVAGGEGLSMPADPDTDPTSRFFIHAVLGDEGFVVVDHAVQGAQDGWRSRFDARWAVHFKRTDSVHYCDPSEVTAWQDHYFGGVNMSSLAFGINSIAAKKVKDGWILISTVPHDDHSASRDFAHEMLYATLEQAKAAAEPIAINDHLGAVEAHRVHLHQRSEVEKRHANISELDAQIVIEKRKHEILRLQLEQAEMQAKLDALTKKE